MSDAEELTPGQLEVITHLDRIREATRPLAERYEQEAKAREVERCRRIYLTLAASKPPTNKHD